MEELISEYFHDVAGFKNIFHPPAKEENIGKVESELGIILPEDYKEFLRITDGFGGFIGETMITFNQVSDILVETEGYCKEYFPWAIHIATNGGGEMFVLDKRVKNFSYGTIPCIADDNDLIILGSNFKEFILNLYKGDYLTI